MQNTIFVVDDNDTNLASAKESLKDQYRVLTMPSAAKMFEMLEKLTPDLILLDIEMPGMDGFEALQRLKENSAQADVPVIFLTSMTDAAVEVRGFQMGAIDFITKPFSAPVLINRIHTHLNIDELIRERTSQLQQRTTQLQHKTTQLENLQNAIIFSFADMVEARDKSTGGHVERVARFIKILFDTMVERGVYTDEIKGIDEEHFVSSSRLHDVGKIAITDLILNKPGKLTDEEFRIMKTHTTEGEYAINQIASRTDDVEFLKSAKQFAGYHHERWDGMGYPYGLSGTDIPIQGRVMALVDVYDALVSKRPYKEPFTEEATLSIIREGVGKHFDPLIADVFFVAADQFREVK